MARFFFRGTAVFLGTLWTFVIAAAACGAQAASGPGADSSRLSLSTVVERALAHFPSVGAARAARDEARAAVGSALASWYPSLRILGTATEYQKPYLVTPLHSFNLNPKTLPSFSRSIFTGALSANYLLFNGGGRESRIREARARAASMDAALGSTEQSLIAKVTTSYLDVIAAAQLLGAHDHRIVALRSEGTRVRQQLDVGRAARVELLRIEATIASAEADRVQAAASLDTAERDLARLVGAPADSLRSARLVSVSLIDTTIESREALLSRGLAMSPAIQQGRRQLAAARAGLGAARAVRWPALNLGGNYLGFADLRDVSGDHEGEWNAILQFSMPLFTGGQIGGDVARANASVRGAEEQLRLAETQLGQQIDRAVSAVEGAHARVASLDSAVATFREVSRIEGLSVQAGVATQTDYLNSVADLFTAEANLAGARYREVEARVELARITGALGPDWLIRNLEGAR